MFTVTCHPVDRHLCFGETRFLHLQEHTLYSENRQQAFPKYK